MMINNSYGPLLQYLPLSLADKAHSNAAAEANAGLGTGPGNGKRTNSDLTDSTNDKKGSGSAVAGKSSLDSANALPGRDSTDIEKSNERTGLVSRSRAEDEEGEVNDFYHPATVEPQRIVWIPEDTLGLSKDEVRACVENGVDASSVNARMDEKGRVEVDGPPPGEEI